MDKKITNRERLADGATGAGIALALWMLFGGPFFMGFGYTPIPWLIIYIFSIGPFSFFIGWRYGRTAIADWLDR